ncbi:ABC transporter ATP-binding protein [Embleya hyalina]|uniref:ABC transporter ATP-binding protein n=1 Tax=Embleya hyalina TaxID=516124 RepID=A0A401YQR7_9ACTN|nr:ABC transporter ATP-binding protein [Embleya hyalina]GCD96933.1 ABC transporter ATP-binding protein [Embleya hyalina]
MTRRGERGRSAEVDSSAPALRLDGLRKVFGERIAVTGLDLTIEPGSFFGLVGPNGAGKTTALSMAVGLLRPDAGTSHVFGADVWQQAGRARELLGVLPDGLAMPEHLTGRELLTYLGRLRRLDRTTAALRTDELLDVMDLMDAQRTPIVDYSTGMRKKIGLATALLHAPKLLVLDEPFEAVDPVSAAGLKHILRRFVAGGGSVLLSSHVMALVEELCDTVAVMAGGDVVAAGPLHLVKGHGTLEDAFVELVGGTRAEGEVLPWLVS